MFQLRNWTTVCVVSLTVAAQAGLAMADSKRSLGRSRAQTGQTTAQRFKSSSASRFQSSQSQAMPSISKYRGTALQTTPPTTRSIPMNGSTPSRVATPVQLSPEVYKKVTPTPTRNSSTFDRSKVSDAIAPMPDGVNQIPGVLETIPFDPMPGDPGGNPDPAPSPDPDPHHCHPWTPWPTWWWFSPMYWPDYGCSPYVIVEASVAVAAPAIDVEFLSVRLVDIGDLEKGLGPRYRVWFRNNSSVAITRPFHVTTRVGNGQKAESLPYVTEPVTAMAAGEVRVLDLRLPLAANQLVIKGASASLLHPMLSVAIDAHEELPESDESNNRATFDRAEIPVVEE